MIMIINKGKAPEGAMVTNRCKGIDNIPIIQKIRSLFLRGGKYTAMEINLIVGTNDARKFISQLRRHGLDIHDLRMEDGSKVYWYPTDECKQLSFWTRWEGVSYE